MAFANILDISSFFIGMLINLLLIALICYYFKRKYESLEIAQNEQAKILYNLIQQSKKSFTIENVVQGVQEINLDKPIVDSDGDSSGSESESDTETDEDIDTEVNELEPEVKTVQVDMEPTLEENVEEVLVTKVEDYSKLTIKELRDLLSKKGINSNHKMKKTDLLNLIETGTQDTLNLSEELSEVNI
jgi:hypothetical protein